MKSCTENVLLGSVGLRVPQRFRNRAAAAALALTTLVSLGCSRTLSPAEAEQAVRNHPAVRPRDTVAVRTVSQAKGSADAIAKATVDGQDLTLRLRWSEAGWIWEYAEVGGGVMPPDVVLEQLRARNHRRRVAAWVLENADRYEATIATIHAYSDDLPRTDVEFTESQWRSLRLFVAELLRASKRSPAEIDALSQVYERPAMDAWGREIFVRFDDPTRTAVFFSVGPDGRANSDDDAVCVVKGVKQWDAAHAKLLWHYGKSWRVPEGLEEIVQAYVSEDPPGHVELTQLVE